MEDFETVSTGIGNEAAKPESKPAPEETQNQPAPSDEGETNEDSGPSENDQESEAEQADDQDQGDGKDQDGSEKNRKKNGFKKRIERFQRQIEERDQEIARLKSNPQQNQPQEKAPTKTDGEPNPNDFETNAEFIKAYTKWELNEEKKKSTEAATQQKIREEQTKVQTDYTNRINEFKKVQTDYEQVVQNFFEEHGDIEVSPVVLEAVQTSEYGPQIAYEIFKNPAEFERLQKMTPMAFLKELGKMEARIALKAEAPKETKPIQKTSKAPAPPKPVNVGLGKTEKSLADMDFDEFMAERNAATRGRR